MSNLLLVTASLFGEQSQSLRLARRYVAAWQQANPDGRVVERDTAGLPHLDLGTFGAALKPADQRSPAEAAAAAEADRVIAEVEAADIIVLTAPLYNFAIPSTLKSWIDHLARAGRTFSYSAAGPKGQLAGKRVVVVSTRGGVYREGPNQAADFVEPYLRTVLGFLGITEVEFLYHEGLKVGPDVSAASLAKAEARIGTLLAERIAA